jgi:hypothetical protein
MRITRVGPLLVGRALRSLLPGRMDAPLDFERVGRTNAFCGADKVSGQPPSLDLAVFVRVAGIPVVRHYVATSVEDKVGPGSADLR